MVSLEDKQQAGNHWPKIGPLDRIPGWLRDNDFLLTGHPLPTFSYKKSYRLWFCLHNETLNIWIHFIGSVAFVAITFLLAKDAITDNQLNTSVGDIVAFSASTIAAAVYFGLSSTFHTLRSHSFSAQRFWGKMDVLGICLLACGCGCSATYYAFYNDWNALTLYWSLSASVTAVSARTLCDTVGGGSQTRSLRGAMFSLLAMSALLPIFHKAILLGWDQACYQIGAHWILAEGVALLVGVGLFVSRLPDRLDPGCFDFLGHSHQLLHSLVVVAAAFHVKALLIAFAYRQLLY